MIRRLAEYAVRWLWDATFGEPQPTALDRHRAARDLVKAQDEAMDLVECGPDCEDCKGSDVDALIESVRREVRAEIRRRRDRDARLRYVR